jgi:P27 family predicted phage terminase small subunit
MKGRKPIPTHLKVITGNRGKRPLNAAEPTPEQVIPPVPVHLSDEAKAEWERVAVELQQLGLLTRIDRAALAAYCQAYADWVEAEAQIKRFGKVIKSPMRTVTRRARDGSEITETSGGYPLQSPFLAIRNKALELMHRFAVEFGMTPSARSRVSANGQAFEDDPAKKYLT